MLGEHWERGGVQWVCRASSSVHCVCHITVSPFFWSKHSNFSYPSNCDPVFLPGSLHWIQWGSWQWVWNNTIPIVATQSSCLVSVRTCSRSMPRTHFARRQTGGCFGFKADSRCPTTTTIPVNVRTWEGGGRGVTLPHLLTCTLHVWPTLPNSMPASVYINNPLCSQTGERLMFQLIMWNLKATFFLLFQQIPRKDHNAEANGPDLFYSHALGDISLHQERTHTLWME